jgi:hypothetical protein
VRGGRVEHFRILEQLLMRREDRGLVGVRFCRQARLQGLELHVRRCNRRVERTALMVRIGSALFQNGIIMAQLKDLADRDAW